MPRHNKKTQYWTCYRCGSYNTRDMSRVLQTCQICKHKQCWRNQREETGRLLEDLAQLRAELLRESNSCQTYSDSMEFSHRAATIRRAINKIKELDEKEMNHGT